MKRATLARKIQDCLCLPSNNDFLNALQDGKIQECGILRRSVKIADQIFGPNKHYLYGKSVQLTNKMPSKEKIIEVPEEVLEFYKHVTVGIDILHVNGIPFILAISKHLNFIQCSGLSSQTDQHFLSQITKFDRVYQVRGFKIKQIYADRRFVSLKSELEAEPHQIKLTTCDKNAHVHVVERAIRFVKERIRGLKSMLPFNRLPRRLLMEIVYSIITKINSISCGKRPEHGMSPRHLITGNKLILPEFKIGDFVHGIPGGTSNCTDTN